MFSVSCQLFCYDNLTECSRKSVASNSYILFATLFLTIHGRSAFIFIRFLSVSKCCEPHILTSCIRFGIPPWSSYIKYMLNVQWSSLILASRRRRKVNLSRLNWRASPSCEKFESSLREVESVLTTMATSLRHLSVSVWLIRSTLFVRCVAYG